MTSREKRRNWRETDPLTPIRGRRVWAASQALQLSANAVKRDLGRLKPRVRITQPGLSKLMKKGDTRCRRSLRDGLGTVLQVPTEWLTGEWEDLPVIPPRNQDLLLAIRLKLEPVLKALRASGSRHLRVDQIRGILNSVLAELKPAPTELVYYPVKLPDGSAKLLPDLRALASLAESGRIPRRSSRPHVDGLADFIDLLPAVIDRDSLDLAQAAKFHLLNGAVIAAGRDADIVGRDMPPRTINRKTRIWNPPAEPWGTCGEVIWCLSDVMWPQLWRRLLLANITPTNPVDRGTDEDRQTLMAASKFLALVLSPWVEGRAELNVGGLMALRKLLYRHPVTMIPKFKPRHRQSGTQRERGGPPDSG